jgi:hypothetical protein
LSAVIDCGAQVEYAIGTIGRAVVYRHRETGTPAALNAPPPEAQTHLIPDL